MPLFYNTEDLLVTDNTLVVIRAKRLANNELNEGIISKNEYLDRFQYYMSVLDAVYDINR